MTGDCRTVLQISRLPLYQMMRQDQEIVVDEFRYTNVYEILKIKDFDHCRGGGDGGGHGARAREGERAAARACMRVEGRESRVGFVQSRARLGSGWAEDHGCPSQWDSARRWCGRVLMGGGVVLRQGGSLGLVKNMNGWSEVKD